jgi:hypothetical protein
MSGLSCIIKYCEKIIRHFQYLIVLFEPFFFPAKQIAASYLTTLTVKSRSQTEWASSQRADRHCVLPSTSQSIITHWRLTAEVLVRNGRNRKTKTKVTMKALSMKGHKSRDQFHFCAFFINQQFWTDTWAPSQSHSLSEWYSAVWSQPSHWNHSTSTLGRSPKNPLPLMGFEPQPQSDALTTALRRPGSEFSRNEISMVQSSEINSPSVIPIFSYWSSYFPRLLRECYEHSTHLIFYFYTYLFFLSP